jgi:hypothetical protein
MRALRLWWMRQHSLSRPWPFCWDCRQAQRAWSRGEFYTHDEPRWYLNRCRAAGEAIRGGTHVVGVSMQPGYIPPSASMNPHATVANCVWSDGVLLPMPQTAATGRARVS